MPKLRSQYICQECGRVSAREMGRCPQCGAWNSMVEEVVATAPPTAAAHAARPAAGWSTPRRLSEISGDAEERLELAIGEFARVLGGGIVPGSIVLIGGDPGIGKCVTGDTRVFDPLSGDYRPIMEWVQGDHRVLAVDEQALKLEPAPISAFHTRGVRSTVIVETELGRRLHCTPDHPLLTPEGWCPAGSLEPGSRIASPRSLPYFGRSDLPTAHIKLIAYILSDGSAQSQIDVTNQLPEVAQDLEEIAAAFGMRLAVYPKPNNRALQYRFVTPEDQRGQARQEIAAALRRVQKGSGLSWADWARSANVTYELLNVWRRGQAAPRATDLESLARAANVPVAELAPEARDRADEKTPVARFLEAVGLRYRVAADKFVPVCIFQLPKERLALFLKTLFTCDGSVYVNERGFAGLSYSTISRRLAEDVQHLLLRFGLVAKLRSKESLVNGQPYMAYEVTMQGVADLQRFLLEIGIMGREQACRRILALRQPRLASTHRDTIPTTPGFWETLRIAGAGSSLKKTARQAGMTFHPERMSGPLCRVTVARLAETYSLPLFQALAHGDVYWDTITSITPAGEAEVYDLSVPEKHNFVANDLIIHNSTLLLQSAMEMSLKTRVLYVSGEESERQIKMRAVRLRPPRPAQVGRQLTLSAPRDEDEDDEAETRPEPFPEELYLVTETNLTTILEHIGDIKPGLLILDSIQTTYMPELDSSAGSVTQVRETASRLRELAKSSGMAVFLIGHVTKEGTIAGPRVLEHIVDTVLYLEGDRFQSYRLLRSVKNRFGATSEVGVFEMGERGMVEITNPSEAFLAERMINAPGSAIAVTMEGTRPLLVEVQGLTSPTSFGNPRRTPNGIDFNRLLLTAAVLTRRVGLRLGEQDIFVNVVGGMTVSEPAADLAVAAAIASSARNIPVRAETVLIGEIGLSGELRMVGQMPARLREAAKLGFKAAIVPRRLRRLEPWPDGLQIIEVRSLRQALENALVGEGKEDGAG